MTIRQRILLYLVLGALAGLACSGIDESIDANLMPCDVAANSEVDCHAAAGLHSCVGAVFANGKCHLSNCSEPCDGSVATNCPFGKTNGGKAWTAADCKNQGLIAGCKDITLYTSLGCYGYTCSDSKCGRH